MTEQESRVIVCPNCGQPSGAIVRGKTVWEGIDDHGAPTGLPAEFAMVQCGRCGQVALQVREDYGIGFDGDEPSIVYPRRHQLSWSVPEPLRREWEEALGCFQAKAYAASLVMVRRTLEGTCMDHGIQERTLLAGLNKLRDQGSIDGLLADWANALRIAGNEGAHYTGRAVSRQDAEDALDFGEAFLDHVYVLRKRFEDFRSRLAEHKKSAQPGIEASS
jgi:hypothetical protein